MYLVKRQFGNGTIIHSNCQIWLLLFQNKKINLKPHNLFGQLTYNRHQTLSFSHSLVMSLTWKCPLMSWKGKANWRNISDTSMLGLLKQMVSQLKLKIKPGHQHFRSHIHSQEIDQFLFESNLQMLFWSHLLLTRWKVHRKIFSLKYND